MRRISFAEEEIERFRAMLDDYERLKDEELRNEPVEDRLERVLSETRKSLHAEIARLKNEIVQLTYALEFERKRNEWLKSETKVDV